MATAILPIALIIVQEAEAAIPGVEALWTAIMNFHNQNPSLTPAQVLAWCQTIGNSIQQRSAIIQQLLAQIPDVPPVVAPVKSS